MTGEMPMKILFTIAVLVASVGQVQAGFIINADGLHRLMDWFTRSFSIVCIWSKTNGD